MRRTLKHTALALVVAIGGGLIPALGIAGTRWPTYRCDIVCNVMEPSNWTLDLSAQLTRVVTVHGAMEFRVVKRMEGVNVFER